MATTIPQLDPISQIQATDVIMITHADGTTEKITGENFMKAMAVDVIAENNMNSVTSNAVARKLKIISSDITLTDQSMSKDCLLYKQGNLVTMNLRIFKEGEVTIQHEQIIAEIPENYKPIGYVYFNSVNFDANNTHQLFVLDGFGHLYAVLQQTYSRLDFYLEATWFTA